MTLMCKTLGIVATGLLLATVSPAATWYVTQSGAGDATTIQSGIDLASAGDTVLVAPGVYIDTLLVTIEGEQKVANVHLNKEISLVAEGDTSDTVIFGPNSDVAVFVEGVGSEGLIQGFRIETQFIPFGCTNAAAARQGTGPSPGYQVGIWCEDSSVAIQGNKIANHGVALVLRRSPVIIDANEISWTFDGVMCEDGSDATITHSVLSLIAIAITITHSVPVIVDNSFGGKGQMCSAIDCNEGGDAYIAGNRFENIRPETIIVGPAAPIIEKNLFINGVTAISMSSGANVPEIRQNIFYDHGSWVLNLRGGSNPIVENNTFDLMPGARAIVMQDFASPVIRNNIIARALIGIQCLEAASPTMECNNIYDTTYRYLDNCPDQTGLNGNISVDPQFCGTWDSGNWELQSDSPCAPGNHPDGYNCGRIGAEGVGCSVTPTRRITIGGLKALFQPKEVKKRNTSCAVFYVFWPLRQ